MGRIGLNHTTLYREITDNSHDDPGKNVPEPKPCAEEARRFAQQYADVGKLTRSLELRKSLPRRPSPESLSSSLHDRMKFAAGGTIPIQGAQWFVANMLTPRAERLG